jgi:GAF domain-containing protein
MIENEDILLEKIENIIKMGKDREGILLDICKVLDQEIDHFHWTGFYLVDPDKENMLKLGPYVGEPTDHINIPFGDGICGQAASTGEVFLVDDVSKETNYLSCSPDVRSEIVIPIFKGEELVGELDIDSHDISAFDGNDSRFLSRVCEIISDIL